MKFLLKETCEFLTSIGCLSKSGFLWETYEVEVGEEQIGIIPERDRANSPTDTSYVPAFCLEDIIRKDNAEKIWGIGGTYLGEFKWYAALLKVIDRVLNYPDTWPEEVGYIIKCEQDL